MIQSVRDIQWMERAVEVAQHGVELGWRPFGAVIVDELNQEVAIGFGTGTREDPTRHSEIVAIKQACRYKRGTLEGCTLYSTHEPCLMCAGACVHAKPTRVVFGSYRADLSRLFRARDYDVASLLGDCSTPIMVHGGVLRAECQALFYDELETLRWENETPV